MISTNNVQTSSPTLNLSLGTASVVSTTVPEKSRPGVKGNSEPAIRLDLSQRSRLIVLAPYPPKV